MGTTHRDSWLSIVHDRFAMLARTSVWSVRMAFVSAPWLMSLTVVLTVLVSLFPSAQALLVSHLTEQVSQGRTTAAIWWAVVVGVFVAGYLALQEVMFGFHRMIQYAFNVHCSVEINTTLAALDPRQISDEQVSRKNREARQAVDEGKVSGQSISLLSLFFAVMVSVSLLAVIWWTSKLAAILIVLSLIPQTVSMIMFSSHDLRGWSEQMDAHRHASYREDQLKYERAAKELAVYDAGALMAGWANTWHRRLGHLQIRLAWLSIRFDTIAGLSSSLLIVGALVSLITAGASASQLAGSLVGILSGIVSMNNVGYMVGMLMSSSVAVQSYLDFIALNSWGSRGNLTTQVVQRSQQNESSSHTSPYIDVPGDNKQKAGNTTDGRQVDSLDVRNLNVVYAGSTQPTVHEVNLYAAKGEMIALVGPNGAGKTTTVQGLMGMLTAPSGHILINGADCSTQPFSTRHHYFGLLTQDYGRYELTVRNNLLIGAGGRQIDDATMTKALHRSHADEIIAKLPHGLDTQLGEQWDGVGLSGGEWQRIALTRLFLRNAPIWILDEPTSNIDAETEAHIFQDLREHSADHITIVVSHRAWTLRDMDRIYVLDHGTIVEHGDYTTLNQAGTRFHELFAFQNEINP